MFDHGQFEQTKTMKTLFTVLGLIATILGLVMAATPLFKMAFIPILMAVLFGGIAFYSTKQKQTSIKTIHLIFLLSIIGLVLTTYKVIFNPDIAQDFKEIKIQKKSNIKNADSTEVEFNTPNRKTPDMGILP